MEVIELKNRVEIFSYNNDIEKNAYMNWRTDSKEKGYNIYVVAQGYATAANILIKEILRDNTDKKADKLIFPILYNINQAIELYEKSIIVILKEIEKEEYNIPNSHDIKQHFNEMSANIKKHEAKTKGLEKHFKVLSNYIDDLYRFIKVDNKVEMDFSRYPIKPNGDNYFYIEDKDNVTVDIENLNTILNEIIDILEGFILMYLQELEYD